MFLRAARMGKCPASYSGWCSSLNTRVSPVSETKSATAKIACPLRKSAVDSAWEKSATLSSTSTAILASGATATRSTANWFSSRTGSARPMSSAPPTIFATEKLPLTRTGSARPTWGSSREWLFRVSPGSTISARASTQMPPAFASSSSARNPS